LGLFALPTSCSVIQSYLEAALAQYALTTIKRRLYAVRKINMLMGFSDPTRTEDFYLAFRRLKRAKPNRPHQAKGVNYELLIEMIDAQPRSLIGHRNRALLSLGYDFLAKRSELAALKLEYLEFLPDDTLRGMIPKSKADQLGHGRLTFGSHRSAELLKIWLKKS
jgi:integrase/recombinase XerD